MTKGLEVYAGRSNETLSNDGKSIAQDLSITAQNIHHMFELDIQGADSVPTAPQRNGTAAQITAQESLPDEILADIFVLSLPGGDVCLKHGPDVTPWTYLKVCSRWRQVAFSEHRL